MVTVEGVIVKGKIVDQGPAQFQVLQQKKDYKSIINTFIIGLAGGAALGSYWSTTGSLIGAIITGILASVAEYYNLKKNYLIKIQSNSKSVVFSDAHLAISELITTSSEEQKLLLRKERINR